MKIQPFVGQGRCYVADYFEYSTQAEEERQRRESKQQVTTGDDGGGGGTL